MASKRSSRTAGAAENPLSIGMESWIESSDVDEEPCQAVETAPLVTDNGRKRLRLSLQKPKATSSKENLPVDRFQFVSDTKAEALGINLYPRILLAAPSGHCLLIPLGGRGRMFAMHRSMRVIYPPIL